MKTLFGKNVTFSRGILGNKNGKKQRKKQRKKESQIYSVCKPLLSIIFLQISWCSISIDEARPLGYAKFMLKILEVLHDKNPKEVFGCKMYK